MADSSVTEIKDISLSSQKIMALPTPDAPNATKTGDCEVQLIANQLDAEGASEVEVLVNVVPPTGARTPVHIVCVVDVSGSMSSSADVPGGKSEATGLSLLDITKHAVKTILHLLGPNDLCSLVAYTDNAEVVFEAQAVTKTSRKKLITQLEALHPKNSTNIWAGVLEGMECVRRASESDNTRQSSVILLTDGLPNKRPPRGEVVMMQKHLDKYPELSFSMNTIGFGYSLDSPLLIDLAKTGNGTYAFIPDSGLVGTVFVNLTSNLLTTMASNLTVSLEPSSDAKIIEVLGGYPGSMESWGWQGSLGALTFEQPRGLVVRMECLKGTEDIYLTATAEYQIRGSSSNTVKVEASISGVEENPSDDVFAEKFRLKTAQTILAAVADITSASGDVDLDKLPKAQEMVASLLEEITASGVPERLPRVADLVKDISGQITEAFSKDKWYKKWGRHFLPSLGRAHLFQQCNNFKDPGVQHYGGKPFEVVRDKADEIFISLPAPKPSRRAPARSAPVNMANSYYSRGNPCFDGGNRAEMADGSFKLVRDCVKGNEVRTCEGFSTIRCVIKTLVAPETELCELPSGLLLTPWHPVRVKNEWVFPSSLAAITTRKCQAVYSFILDAHHSMFIESTEAVTLGHNFKDNAVIRHPYFGSQAIIQDLQNYQEWEAGLIVFENDCMQRNEETGLLYKFRSEKALSSC